MSLIQNEIFIETQNEIKKEFATPKQRWFIAHLIFDLPENKELADKIELATGTYNPRMAFTQRLKFLTQNDGQNLIDYLKIGDWQIAENLLNNLLI